VRVTPVGVGAVVSLYPAPGTGAGYRPRVPDIGMVVPDEFALFHPYFDFLCRNMRKRNESTVGEGIGFFSALEWQISDLFGYVHM